MAGYFRLGVGYAGALGNWTVTYGTDPTVRSVTIHNSRVRVSLSLSDENVFNFCISLRLNFFNA